MFESDRKPTRNRRWLRFSIRKFLIVATIVGFLLGWISSIFIQLERQKDAVSWIKQNGGKVYYANQVSSNGAPLIDENGDQVEYKSSLGPEWVVSIDLSFCGTDLSKPLELEPLMHLARLENLDLRGCNVSDLKPLASVKSLESLELWNTLVHDLKPLARLTKLKTLGLSDTPIDDLTPLRWLKNLEALDLSHTQIVDLTPLSGLTKLKELELWKTKIDDLSPLRSLTNLEKLDLSHTQVSKVEIEELSQALPNCKIQQDY